jgi:hypothetical protein
MSKSTPVAASASSGTAAYMRLFDRLIKRAIPVATPDCSPAIPATVASGSVTEVEQDPANTPIANYKPKPREEQPPRPLGKYQPTVGDCIITGIAKPKKLESTSLSQQTTFLEGYQQRSASPSTTDFQALHKRILVLEQQFRRSCLTNQPASTNQHTSISAQTAYQHTTAPLVAAESSTTAQRDLDLDTELRISRQRDHVRQQYHALHPETFEVIVRGLEQHIARQADENEAKIKSLERDLARQAETYEEKIAQQAEIIKSLEQRLAQQHSSSQHLQASKDNLAQQQAELEHTLTPFGPLTQAQWRREHLDHTIRRITESRGRGGLRGYSRGRQGRCE